MPARPPHAKTSVSHSHGAKWPRRGSVKVWTRSWAYPVTRVRKRIGKETMTSQWAHLIQGRPLNSRWVSAADMTPQRRLPTGVRRPGSGVPAQTVRHMWVRPRANDRTATALTSRASPHMMALSVGLATFPPQDCCTPLCHLDHEETDSAPQSVRNYALCVVFAGPACARHNVDICHEEGKSMGE